MDLSLLTNNELRIVHCYTHNSYTLSKPTFNKKILKKFHDKIISQNKLNHYKFDKLDDI